MVILKRLFVLPLVLVSCLLAAQESGFFVTKTGEDFQLRQVISFPADQDAAGYEVELERIENGRTIPVDRITTETNRIELSLKSGSYRYRITSFNGWGLVNGVSDWQNFAVFPAVQPKAETYQPFYGLYYELADPDGALILNGRDFTGESEFALVTYGEEIDWTGISLRGLKGVVFPEQTAFNEDYTQAVLTFKRKALKQGEYSIFIRNPGGLWTVFGQVRVGYRKSTDWTLSFGWMPMIAVFDYENAYEDRWEWDYSTQTMNQLDGQRLGVVNPRAWYLRIGWFPVKTRLGNFGLEVTVISLQDDFHARRDGKDFGYQVSEISGGHLDLVYQLELSEQWQGNIRFGMGYGDEYHHNSKELYDDDEAPVLLNFGFSVQYFIWKNLYAEGGIDLQYMTLVDHTMIRPFLGLGWQFGRWAEYAEVTKAIGRGEDPSVPVTEIPKGEFIFSLGWSPMIPLFGIARASVDRDWNNSIMAYDETKTTELWPVNPLGAYFRAVYIPYRWGKNKLGAGLSFYILNRPGRKEITDKFYKGLDILSHAQIEALYQRVLTGSWQLNARAGMGISHPYAYTEADGAADIPVFSMNAGTSVQYFFWKNAYVEAGLDFVFSFGDVKHGMFRPGIGIGWQFNRDVPTGFTEDGLRFFRKPAPAADAE
ncbi:MAG: hypothetical protein LBK77_01915 [Spirochaetaceae bacterium]|jgi:hypothetical protein|nr:hypothetical protein [Spirochaetaceae bacterium]